MVRNLTFGKSILEVPMSIHTPKPAIGLDNVPAAETTLSHVDGERGELIIAGRRVGELVQEGGFEHATSLLWSSASGKAISAAEVRRAFGEGRVAAYGVSATHRSSRRIRPLVMPPIICGCSAATTHRRSGRRLRSTLIW